VILTDRNVITTHTSLISTRTRLISTRRVRFPHTECDFYRRMWFSHTHEYHITRMSLTSVITKKLRAQKIVYRRPADLVSRYLTDLLEAMQTKNTKISFQVFNFASGQFCQQFFILLPLSYCCSERIWTFYRKQSNFEQIL
jgi:hypothetical protein